MNILATYASSYVNAFDVALSARSEQPAGKHDDSPRRLPARLRLRVLLGRPETAEAA